ncbi:MAG: glycosyltransferase [Gemmatimonadota bacterium]
MGRALRIAAHNGAPDWGGAEIAVVRLLLGLEGRGHAVRIYCNDREVKRRAADAGLLARRERLGGDIAVHHALRFARELRRRQPDVLVLGTFRKLWLGALAARLAGVPRVVARVGLETDMPRNAKYRFVFARWIDAVVFNADGMRRRFLEVMPDFPGETATILTGVRAPATRGGTAFRAMLGIPLGAPLVGSVGRLAEQKRYDRLIPVLRSVPEAHAVVVGEGPERGRLEAAAREAEVAPRLHLPGHQDDVGPALDAMDLFVLTSDREGLSNAMLEALAAGVPVLSTDVSGAREALDPLDDGNAPGRVVGFGADAIAGAVRELIGDRARLGAMGETARRVARERFAVERMLDRWERILAGDSNGEG